MSTPLDFFDGGVLSTPLAFLGWWDIVDPIGFLGWWGIVDPLGVFGMVGGGDRQSGYLDTLANGHAHILKGGM